MFRGFDNSRNRNNPRNQTPQSTSVTAQNKNNKETKGEKPVISATNPVAGTPTPAQQNLQNITSIQQIISKTKTKKKPKPKTEQKFTALIEQCPNEVWVNIFAWLPISDLLRLSRINKHFYGITQEIFKFKSWLNNLKDVSTKILTESFEMPTSAETSITTASNKLKEAPPTTTWTFLPLLKQLSFFNSSKTDTQPKQLTPSQTIEKSSLDDLTRLRLQRSFVQELLNFLNPTNSLISSSITKEDRTTIRKILLDGIRTLISFGMQYNKGLQFSMPLLSFLSALNRTKQLLSQTWQQQLITDAFHSLNDIINKNIKILFNNYQKEYFLPLVWTLPQQDSYHDPLNHITSNIQALPLLDFKKQLFFAIKSDNQIFVKIILNKNLREAKKNALIEMCVLIGTPQILALCLTHFDTRQEHSIADRFYLLAKELEIPLIVSFIKNDLNCFKEFYSYANPPQLIKITENSDYYIRLEMAKYLSSEEFAKHPTWKAEFPKYLRTLFIKNDSEIRAIFVDAYIKQYGITAVQEVIFTVNIEELWEKLTPEFEENNPQKLDETAIEKLLNTSLLKENPGWFYHPLDKVFNFYAMMSCIQIQNLNLRWRLLIAGAASLLQFYEAQLKIANDELNRDKVEVNNAFPLLRKCLAHLARIDEEIFTNTPSTQNFSSVYAPLNEIFTIEAISQEIESTLADFNRAHQNWQKDHVISLTAENANTTAKRTNLFLNILKSLLTCCLSELLQDNQVKNTFRL